MKSLLVVVLLLGVTFGQITINYKSDANVSLSNLNDFKFRATSLGTFSVPTLYNGAFVSSLSIDINQGSATIDAVHGAAYSGVNFNPAAYLAYFSSASFWTGVTNYLTANVSAAAGFVGNSYLLLEEVNEESVLQEINFNELLWTQESANAGNGGLRYVTFKGSQFLINPNFNVYLTFTISDVVGVIQVGAGEAIVTPKTLESIVQIKNFPYQNTANSVRLTLGVATAAATLQATGQFNHYVAGSGLNGAYFSLSNQAVYGTEVAPVQIGAFVSGSADVAFGTNADLVAQVQSVYKAAAQFSIVTVTFKSGANDIVYDPTLGVGSNPPEEESSTSIIAPLVFMLFILVSLF